MSEREPLRPWGESEETQPSIKVEHTVDNPLELQGENGPIVCGTDKGFGYKDHNEDALIVSPEFNAFAVIDGMGGGKKSSESTQVLASTFSAMFDARNTNFEATQIAAHQKMKEDGLTGHNEGACYLAAIIEEDGKITIAQAGDVRLIITNRATNEVRFESEDENLHFRRNVVTNSVTGTNPGITTLSHAYLNEGDRIIAATDGLWDSIGTVEVVELIQGKSAQEALTILEEETRRRMEDKTGKPDNRAILIYDYDRKD